MVSRKNSFKKARKQVVTTKLFMNVHFCSLGIKTYRFQLVKFALQEQLLNLKSLWNKTGFECFWLRSSISSLNVPIQLWLLLKILTCPRLLVILSRTQMLENFSNSWFSTHITWKSRTGYMYLKTYAKFTFCIKSPGHVSDENFLYYCMHLAGKISSYGVWNI